MGPSQTLQNIEDSLHKPTHEEKVQALSQNIAAVNIQRAWRKRQRARYLGPEFLWSDISTRARFKVDRNAASRGDNDPRQRWHRAVFLIGQLEDGNEMLAHPEAGEQYEDASRKHLETQHWLELIDGRHRYGSNLKWYHRKWQGEDTPDNFFHWLDEGGGKDLSLKECPRDQLEKERIAYLSPEERLNYLVQIDREGKLRWAKNGQLVDTTAGRWKDGGGSKGIVPLEHPTSAGSSLSGDQVEQAVHYYGARDLSRNPIKRILWRSFTLKGLLDRLLRKTIKRNTWIYVSDKNFNIFIGIKDPGTFQHSSFLGGGLVTSAGLISVKDGVIHTLSPLSGHYRTSISHFRQFLSILEDRGVDMRKVEISKAEAALWGIEHIGKFKKKQAALVKAGKDGVEDATQNVVKKVHVPTSNSSWRREILEGRCRDHEAAGNSHAPEDQPG